MTCAEMAQMEKLANASARRYKALCWWADVEDMRQEAYYAMLRAHRTFDPNEGVPLGAYLWAACVRWLRGYLWKNSSPVSASWDKLDELAGLHRAPLTAVANLAADSTPERMVGQAEWRQQVRVELRDLAAQLAMPDFLGGVMAELEPVQQAEQRAVPVRQVYRERERLVHLAKQDARLYALWEEGD